MSGNKQTNFLIALTGNNFSGRSSYLKSISINAPAIKGGSKFSYIGELPSNFISGIFPTVKNEIDLHSVETDPEILKHVNDLFAEYDFGKHLSKNPFTLSGGEQTILVILSSLLLQPKIIAIDTAMEQLNEEWREPLLKAIVKGKFPDLQVFFADNRLDEYHIPDLTTISPDTIQKDFKFKFEKPIVDHQLSSSVQSQNVEIKDLSFSYDKSQIILRKINVSLEPGKVYILKGRNGAGKTTLAKILTGILKTRHGQLLVNGSEYNAFEYPGRLVGYSFQNPDEQLFSSTVESEVLISLKNEKPDYTQRREIFLHMFGLIDVRKCHPAELPFVIRKRISLAATLATDRPWYILDEPTLGQDNSFTEFLITLLNDLTNKGKGIIIISHSNSFTQKLNGKNLNLRDGKLTS